MRKMIAAVAMGAALAASASAANATVTGFQLDMGGSLNSGKLDQPTFKLSNLSDIASLTSFSITFGPSIYNIDRLTNPSYGGDVPPQIDYTIVTPDGVDGALRDDGILVNFGNFAAGDYLTFALEFDEDNKSSTVDVRKILWNNGALANAVLTVGFSDGTKLTQTMPDTPADQRSWTFSGQSVSAVPEPATWAMMILGLGGMGVALRNRRRITPAVAS